MDEDESRLFYTVVVPGFSVISITGRETLREGTFSVTDLVTIPEIPEPDTNFIVRASVTNTADHAAVYPANLWIADTIEATQTIRLRPGETRFFEFTLNRPQGRYSLRIEKELHTVDVGLLPTVTPIRRAPPLMNATFPSSLIVSTSLGANPYPVNHSDQAPVGILSLTGGSWGVA